MLLKMWKILIIFVSFSFTSYAQVPEDGDCYLEEVETTDWQFSFKNDPVDDDAEEFRRFKAENIESVAVRGTDYAKYFQATLEDGYLIVSPKEAFKNYEEEEESVAAPEMNIELAFVCTNDNSKLLRFYQPIRDLNTYFPAFKQPSYTYELPMPLPANFDIGIFGATIEACDTDISNVRLDFSISPDEDFYLSWGGPISGSKNKCHTAVIKTKNRLRLTTSKAYEITVTDIGDPSKDATAKFIIEIDEEATFPTNPLFDSAYYTATYNSENDPHSIAVKGDINLREGCSNLKLLDLIGDRQDHFEVSCVEENVVVKLIKNLPEDVLKDEDNPIVLITIEATLENAEEPGKTVLVVYLPKQECPEVTTPTPTTCPSTVMPTDCPICPTELTTSYTCSPCNTECPTTPADCPPCSTTPGDCPSIPTECPLTCPPCSTTPGECPSTSTECPLTCPPCSTTPSDCQSVSTECPVSCPTPELTTECPPFPTTPGECSSPPTEGPVTCPTPGETTECPPCSTTPEPQPPQTVIKFEQDNYWYKVKTWHVGYVIGVVKASVTPKEDIEYSIVPDAPDKDFLECDEKTGELIISQQVEAGTYNFIAYAEGVETKMKTQTEVVVEIINGDDDEEPESKNSILVIHVTEEEEKDIPLPCEYTYCNYEPAQQYPTTDEDIFKLENNILHVAKIKRERKEIIEMLVPQFSLHLFITKVGASQDKDNRSNNSLRAPSKATKEILREWALIPADVPNLSNQLLLSIIIDDINNNPPVFEIGSELVVGYPIAELAIQLTPPYLVKVVATDLDAGENAIIRYSTDSSHFTVHPETGVVYPGEDAFDDESNLMFTVTATDKIGAEDGNQAHLNIEVKLLKQENLIVLVVKNLMLEDIDDTMQELSEKTNMKINYLTAAVIPLDNTKDSLFEPTRQLKKFVKSMVMPKANSDHSSRIIVYGLNTENEPVETEDLQKSLEDAGVLENFTIDKWEPGYAPEDGTDGEDDSSTAGFIAAIAVLASLLVIFMIAAAAFYYFKIYRVNKSEPYNTMEEEDTNSVNYEKAPRTSTVSRYEEAPQRRVTGYVTNPPPIEEDEDEFGERTYEDTNEYGMKDKWDNNNADMFVENKVKFVDTPEDDLYGETKAKFEDSPTDFDGDYRKSVTFKETVEKINIIVDDTQDDDTLDERL